MPPPLPLLLLLLLLSFATTTLSYHVSKAVSGTVTGGNVAFYQVTSTNPVVMVLISEEGDADLYASPTHINPKPSSEDHEINSASCGLDMLSLIMKPSLQKYSLGVYGHVRYDQSRFNLYFIEPSQEDIRSYQVWDWDYDLQREVLVIDADPMRVVNDPELNDFIDQIRRDGSVWVGSAQGRGNKNSAGSQFLEFVGAVLLKLLEIVIEVIA